MTSEVGGDAGVCIVTVKSYDAPDARPAGTMNDPMGTELAPVVVPGEANTSTCAGSVVAAGESFRTLPLRVNA